MASKPRVFLDSSVLISGMASPSGASRAILTLADAELITLVVSEQVLTESERDLREKLPWALAYYQRVISMAVLEIEPDPSLEEIETARRIIHPKDAPILAAAMAAQVDYLVTLDREHFLDDPEVARQAGLRIGLPGHFLAWFRAWVEGAEFDEG